MRNAFVEVPWKEPQDPRKHADEILKYLQLHSTGPEDAETILLLCASAVAAHAISLAENGHHAIQPANLNERVAARIVQKATEFADNIKQHTVGRELAPA